MSQVFGYLCSDDSLTAEVMKQEGAPLQAILPEDRVGMGIGWLQEGRSLLRKHPKRKAAEVDIRALVGDVPTRALVGHVRHKDLGKAGTNRLQPYRFRNWVYAQCGGGEGLEEASDALRASVPDHVRRNIQGASMAELVFHIFYTKVESSLSITPKNDWPRLYAEKLGETMSELEALSRQVGEKMGTLVAVAVSDRCMAASRIGEPLHYRLIEGIEEPKEKPLFAGHRPKRITHDKFRALLVANRIDEENWVEIPDRHVLWVDSDWEIEFEPIAGSEASAQ